LRYAVQQFSDFFPEFVHGSFGGFAQQRPKSGKYFSIGFNSGESGGGYRTAAPIAMIAFSTPATL
jgi:hypothetical protein